MIALTLAFCILSGCSETGKGQIEMDQSKETHNWPGLDSIKFTAGRTATQEDVAAEKAVFVLDNGGVSVGTPIDMTIPQYAFHVNSDTGEKTPCIIIQAEQADGQKVIGAESVLDRSFMAGTLPEFELLGTSKPD